MQTKVSVKTKFGWISAYEHNGKIFRIKFGKEKKQNPTKTLKHDFLPGYKEFEVGTGKSQELKIFCLALAKVFNVPYDTLNFGSLDHRPNEIMDSSANNIDLKSIGWAPVWSLNSAMSDLAKKQRWLEN